MLRRYRFDALDATAITQLIERKLSDDEAIFESCRQIADGVRQRGDAALIEYAQRFDRTSLTTLQVSSDEIDSAAAAVTPELQAAIALAHDNLRTFHERQKPQRLEVETTKGVRVWREFRPLDRAGLYIPGGSAPLFSTVLMLGVPALVAGCQNTVLCTPPQPNGKIAPEILFAAQLMGITQIFAVGGAQAIFAMAYGTESIPKCDKIFGPGNRFVTTAKQLVQNRVAIDMPAGPSEVLVIADADANPAFVAADLLSQAEHGSDSQCVLVTDAPGLIAKVEAELLSQLERLPRRETAQKALQNSFLIETARREESFWFSNRYAPEHLILHLDNWEDALPMVQNAGSVFCGAFSPESVGDYASGTNHVLPTAGFARNFSGVSVESFGKFISFQHLSKEGLSHLGPVVETMAAAEGLDAHKHAVSLRLAAGT